jgi:hypothetical protein
MILCLMFGEGVDYRALVRDAVGFGARTRDGWGVGLTILTPLGNLIPSLPEEACDPAARRLLDGRRLDPYLVARVFEASRGLKRGPPCLTSPLGQQ